MKLWTQNRRGTLTGLIAAVTILPALPSSAETPVQKSTCAANCLLTSCSITCSSGGVNGAVCTCAYGVATCACGGGGKFSSSIAEGPPILSAASNQNVVWREAGPRAAAREPVVPSARILYVPSREHREDLVAVRTVLRAFDTLASREALAAAERVHTTLMSGDVAANEEATRRYLDAIEALDPPQRAALSLFIDNAEACGSASDSTEISGGSTGSWTAWLNRDSPGGSGDYETLEAFVAGKQVSCAAPTKVECRTLDDTDWSKTGQTYTCKPNVGGVCRHSDQATGRCHNYKVRFLCP